MTTAVYDVTYPYMRSCIRNISYIELDHSLLDTLISVCETDEERCHCMSLYFECSLNATRYSQMAAQGFFCFLTPPGTSTTVKSQKHFPWFLSRKDKRRYF